MTKTSLSFLFTLALLSAVEHAQARGRGVIGTGCGGCHGYEGNSTAELTPLSPQLGSTTTLRFTIRDPGAEVGGVYIGLADPEQFSLGDGSGLAEVSGGLTHTSPRSFSGGQMTYEFEWNVPSTPGATRFTVGWVTGNGNGNNSGDEGNSGEFDIVYGCEPQTYYRDLDGDGFGSTEFPRIYCANTTPDGYAAQGGDCVDTFASRYPGAIELCNQRDDDCDGEIDEGAIPVQLYPDDDGDGFYSEAEFLGGDTVMGCVPTPGYAVEGGDCSPDNASIHPGAEEVCDLATDENCDGRIDERTRPLCGKGWCARASYSCDIKDCVPGLPSEELCNFIDDDCDGEVDEGDLCDAGFICAAGQCLDAAEIEVSTFPENENPPAGGGASGTDGTGHKASDDDSSPAQRKTTAACSQRPDIPASPLRFLAVLVLAGLALRRRRHR